MKRCFTLLLFASLVAAALPARAQTWARNYSGPNAEEFLDLVVDFDRATVFAGYRVSAQNGREAWVVKVDPCGFIEWQRSFGGQADDEARTIVTTDSGGYLVAGQTRSFGAGGSDNWVLLLDGDGNLLHDAVFGGPFDDGVVDALEVGDGFIVAANAFTASGLRDFSVVKLKPDLSVDWSRVFAEPGDDEVAALTPALFTGGFVALASSTSEGPNDRDLWILEFSSAGDVVNQRVYDGAGRDVARDIEVFVFDGLAGYAVAADTEHPSDGNDAWFMTLDPGLSVIASTRFGGSGTQTAFAVGVSFWLPGFVLVADISDGIGGRDTWLIALDETGAVTTAQKTFGSTGVQQVAAVQENIISASLVFAGRDDTDAYALRLNTSLEIESACPLEGTTSIAGTPLVPTELFSQIAGQSSSVTLLPSNPSQQDTPALVQLTCTGRPSEVSGLDPLRGSTGFLEPLTLGAGGTATWEPSSENCSATFNIYIGDLFHVPQFDFGSCLISEIQTNSTILAPTPQPGGGFAFLVSGVNAAGEGTLGFTSTGFERSPTAVCP